MVEQKMSGIACYCFRLQTKQPFSHHVLAGCHNEPFRFINTRGFYSQYISFGFVQTCLFNSCVHFRCFKVLFHEPIVTTVTLSSLTKTLIRFCRACLSGYKMPSCDSWTPLAWEKMFMRSEFLITLTQVLLGIWGQLSKCVFFLFDDYFDAFSASEHLNVQQ